MFSNHSDANNFTQLVDEAFATRHQRKFFPNFWLIIIRNKLLFFGYLKEEPRLLLFTPWNLIYLFSTSSSKHFSAMDSLDKIDFSEISKNLPEKVEYIYTQRQMMMIMIKSWNWIWECVHTTVWVYLFLYMSFLTANKEYTRSSLVLHSLTSFNPKSTGDWLAEGAPYWE